jgi:hypothetical protein
MANKYKVKIGEEFELEGFGEVTDKTIKASSESVETLEIGKMRSKLAVWTFATGVGFLMAAAIVGLFKGDFAALSSVWAAIAFPMGAVFSTYFKVK